MDICVISSVTNKVLRIFSKVCLGGHTHSFLKWNCWSELCICLALVNSATFPKWLHQYTYTLTDNVENSHYSTFLPTVAVISPFNSSHSGRGRPCFYNQTTPRCLSMWVMSPQNRENQELASASWMNLTWHYSQVSSISGKGGSHVWTHSG